MWATRGVAGEGEACLAPTFLDCPPLSLGTSSYNARFSRVRNMHRIKTFNQIAQRGLRRFNRERFEVGREVSDPHAILLRSHKLNVDDATRNLLAVARAGAGINNVPVDEYSDRGIVVFNTPGANANSVKELVVAAMLLGSRDIVGGIKFVDAIEEGAKDLHSLVESNKKSFRGNEIQGRTLGVVGLGNVGSRVARAALDLGMQVVGYDPFLSVSAAWRVPSQVRQMESMQSLFQGSDYISLHVPLSDDTMHLVSRATLKNFRDGAVLLNFAREEVVHAAGVREALISGKLRWYFSDFPVPELLGLPNVHCTPHLGASTGEAEENCAVMAADQLIEFLGTGNVRNSVNFPEVSLDPSPGWRIAITNANVPTILGQITSVLAERKINVIDMINKSRDALAYNLIDIEAEPDKDLLAHIEAIESVVNLRVIE